MENRINNTGMRGQMMKAVICPEYGSPDVLELMEVEKPLPKDNEVLIRIHAASINAYDLHVLRASPFLTRFSSGLFKPRNQIPGADIAGVVASVGKAATRYKLGDEVYGCLESCGAGGIAAGGFAQYVCAKETVLAPKPPCITFEQAASVPMAAITALQGLRDLGRLQSEQKVLINGASGGVGTFAVQIAKSFGAEVTGVCSKRNLDRVRSLGADHVIDYAQEDFSRSGQHYDLILDIAANRSISDYKRVLSPKGICVVVGFSTVTHMIQVAFGAMVSKPEGKRMAVLYADNTRSDDLIFMNELLETQRVVPVIDGCYPLCEVASAFWYFEKNHAQGKVVLHVV